MRKVRLKTYAGFSLLELMVVVAIIGVLATFAVPRFNIFRARARQGEAKSNLGVIFTLQEAFKIDKEEYYNGNGNHWGGGWMDKSANADGYINRAASSPGTPAPMAVTALANDCKANKLGFRLANCTAARYRYWMGDAVENNFVAYAAAYSNITVKRIFPGCEGSAASAKKKPSTSDTVASLQCDLTGLATGADQEMTVGDAFCLDSQRKVDNFKDIVAAEDCKD